MPDSHVHSSSLIPLSTEFSEISFISAYSGFSASSCPQESVLSDSCFSSLFTVSNFSDFSSIVPKLFEPPDFSSLSSLPSSLSFEHSSCAFSDDPHPYRYKTKRTATTNTLPPIISEYFQASDPSEVTLTVSSTTGGASGTSTGSGTT